MNMDWIISDKIALYGLGTETERLISQWGSGLKIIGLLDGYKESGELYGYPIISLQQAVDTGVQQIIVVARPGSCKVIAKRIKEICQVNNISVFDVRGNDLLVEREPRFSFEEIIAYTKPGLKRSIDEAEIVSFDLFDTLIMRRVSSYTDIFDLVDLQLRRNGIVIENFSGKRLAAEKELSILGAPKLTEIYARVLDGDERISPEKLSEIEWKLDKKSFVLRADMKEILDYAKESGKILILTSDSYYCSEKILKILEINNIDYFNKLYISCDCGTSKTNGLFELVGLNYEGHQVLHIGDDEWADVEMANRMGIVPFRIYSGKDLYDSLGGMNLESNIKSLSDRIKLGLFIANLFSSPFQFENGERRVKISKSENIGYDLCGPMILDFMIWMNERAKSLDLDNILLCARDGFLIQKIYDLLSDDRKAIYFLTSRIAAIRAGVVDEADIEYVDGMKFFGGEQESLRVRFGVESKNQILKQSKMKRKNYLKYISTLGLGTGTLGVFDFVAKGTTQLFLQKTMSQSLRGLYFLQLEPEFMRGKNLKIEAFYTDEEKDTSSIYDNYYILETILTSPMPSLDEFDEAGHPVYAAETRNPKNLACVEKLQQGILDYVEDFISLMPIENLEINKPLDEAFLTLVHKLEVSASDFRSLVVEDPFFGRMTKIVDVLE